MKILEREKLKHEESKENTLYVFTKSKSSWLGYFKEGSFFTAKSNKQEKHLKLNADQVNLLLETEFTSNQFEQAYEKYSKAWFGEFTDALVLKRVKYTGALLTEESHKLLCETMKHLVPENWKLVAHHMTLGLGELKLENVHLLGKKSTLKVVGYSLDLEKGVMAVKVESEFESKSVFKHVTFALAEGTKAVTSNELTDFVEFEMEELNVVVSYFLNNNEVVTSPL